MKVLYAGDSAVGGPANYLLGILNSIGANVTHVPPFHRLSASVLKKKFDLIILSDFPKKNMPKASEEMVLCQIENGTGFLMVGGWGSFSGPFGKWRGSLIEKILPVTCSPKDDRVNFPGGALAVQAKKHPCLIAGDFKNPPVICGLNHLIPRKESLTILEAKRITVNKIGNLKLERHGRPLLVVNRNAGLRTAALATDLAPHWCGGLVDWGRKSKKIKVKNGIYIEVGDMYVRFVASLLLWLADQEKKSQKLKNCKKW